jgi:hypothetical protein
VGGDAGRIVRQAGPLEDVAPVVQRGRPDVDRQPDHPVVQSAALLPLPRQISVAQLLGAQRVEVDELVRPGQQGGHVLALDPGDGREPLAGRQRRPQVRQIVAVDE